MEKVGYGGDERSLSRIGFCVRDISGDSVPELVIGELAEDSDGNRVTNLLDCYTVKGGTIVSVFHGMVRDNIQWLYDNHFFSCGSGGVSLSLFGERHYIGVPEDAEHNTHSIETVWDDFYYTSENDAGGVSYYHNTTGGVSEKEGELLNITHEEFWEIHDRYQKRCTPFPLVPLADY